jgi:hypothetical protein
VTAYAALDEFLALPEIESHDPGDDVFIESLLERASREFDGDTGHWFYAHQQVRRFDTPRGRCLEVDVPLLSVTSITNGDNTTLPSTEYILTPYNGVHKTAVELYEDSTYVWELSTSARRRGVIYVNGEWGYVDRDATDPESAVVISNSKTATLALALAVYRRRHGVGVTGVATVTAAGVVITPADKTAQYWSIVEIYRRHL